MRQHNDSERKVQALPATAIQPHARKGVENNCVFSLSFGLFSFSFYSQQKRKKRTRKMFLFEYRTVGQAVPDINSCSTITYNYII